MATRGRAAIAAAAAAIGFSAYSHLSSGPPDRLARWQDKWDNKTTAWHLAEQHPLLLKYHKQLLERQPHESPSPKKPSVLSHESPSPKKPSVLFPLCGSSVDLGHLALRGHPVYGVEGVKVAVDQLLSAFGQEGVPLPGAQDHRRQAAAAGLKLRTAVAPGEAGLDTPVELKVGST